MSEVSLIIGAVQLLMAFLSSRGRVTEVVFARALEIGELMSA